MRTGLGLLVGLSLVVVACGGDDDSTATTVAVDPAARFVQLVDPVNCAVGAAMQASNDSWQAARTAAADVVTTEEALVAGIADTDWPDDAQPAIDEFADAVSRQLDAWRDVGDASTEDEVRAAADQLDSTASDAANAVRAELGLPEAEAFCPGQGG